MLQKLLLFLLSAILIQAVEVSEKAPEFELKSHEGKTVRLSDFSGKIIVLEWTNAECPFVKAHYEPRAMQKLQETLVSKGVVWLQILSSAPGHQGYLATSQEAKSLYDSQKMKSTAFLLDPSGSVGKAYGAKTTPHLFVIGTTGIVAYTGAIDSNPRPEFDPQAQNYVTLAVNELLTGKKISIPSTKPYGCAVKY